MEKWFPSGKNPAPLLKLHAIPKDFSESTLLPEPFCWPRQPFQKLHEGLQHTDPFIPISNRRFTRNLRYKKKIKRPNCLMDSDYVSMPDPMSSMVSLLM